MSVTLGDAIVWIRGDDSKYQGDLNRAKGTTDTWTAGIGHSISTAFGSFLGGVAVQAVNGVVNALQNVASAALSGTAAMQQMQVGLEGLLARELANGDATKANYEGIADAMPDAQKKAKALMGELAKIAILSPYQLENVQNTFKMAMAFGYTADEAKKFTTATLDMGAGVGAGAEQLDRMAYNLAQIRMVGKVTAMDVRQLAMAGMDLTSVLKYTGEQYGVNIKTTDDFNAAIESGQITWAQFTEAYAKYADKNFGGASERMSKTLMGLSSTFKDVFVLTIPQILGPAAEEVTGFLTDLMDSFLSIRDSGVLESIGTLLGVKVRDALVTVKDWLGKTIIYAQGLWSIFKQDGPLKALNTALRLLVPPELRPVVDALTNSLGDFITWIRNDPGVKQFFDDVTGGLTLLGLFWQTNGAGILLGLGNLAAAIVGIAAPEAVTGVSGLGTAFKNAMQWLVDNGPGMVTTLNDVATWVRDNKDEILAFLLGVAAVTAIAELPAIVASIAAGLALMITPLGLVAVGIGLLSAKLVEYGEKLLGANAKQAMFEEKLKIGFWGVLRDASQSSDMLARIAGAIVDELGREIMEALNTLGMYVGMIIQLMGAKRQQFFDVSASLVNKFLEGLQNTWKNVVSWAEGAIKDLLAKFAITIPMPSFGGSAPAAAAPANTGKVQGPVRYVSGYNRTTGEPIYSYRAGGGPVAAGGAYTWNEPGNTGEVLVPLGSGYVLNKRQAQQALAGALGGGGGNMTVNIFGPVVREKQDIEALAYQVVTEIQNKRR